MSNYRFTTDEFIAEIVNYYKKEILDKLKIALQPFKDYLNESPIIIEIVLGEL